MSKVVEVEAPNLHPDIAVPRFPATRLTDDHYASLRRVSKLPLVSFILTIAAFVVGLINADWIPVLNLLALAFAALTVLSTVVLLLFVVQARKKQQAALQSAIQVLLPLVRKKYDLDVNADLLESLMSGANLPLFMQGEITRVGLRNLRKQAILVVFETVEESEDSITAE